VLEHAAAAAGWGSELPDGHGMGIGLARYKGNGAYCAVVAEVEATDRIRVRTLTIAVDVGRVVNPDGVRNQIGGGATQATSWTLKERVRFDRRRVTSVDWESYPILRFTEAPEVVVHLLDRPDLPPVGAGEADMEDAYFSPTVLRGGPGQKIRLTLRSRGETPHHFTTSDEQLIVEVQPGLTADGADHPALFGQPVVLLPTTQAGRHGRCVQHHRRRLPARTGAHPDPMTTPR
jgi:hypothetical protein